MNQFQKHPGYYQAPSGRPPKLDRQMKLIIGLIVGVTCLIMLGIVLAGFLVWKIADTSRQIADSAESESTVFAESGRQWQPPNNDMASGPQSSRSFPNNSNPAGSGNSISGSNTNRDWDQSQQNGVTFDELMEASEAGDEEKLKEIEQRALKEQDKVANETSLKSHTEFLQKKYELLLENGVGSDFAESEHGALTKENWSFYSRNGILTMQHNDYPEACSSDWDFQVFPKHPGQAVTRVSFQAYDGPNDSLKQFIIDEMTKYFPEFSSNYNVLWDQGIRVFRSEYQRNPAITEIGKILSTEPILKEIQGIPGKFYIRFEIAIVGDPDDSSPDARKLTDASFLFHYIPQGGEYSKRVR